MLEKFKKRIFNTRKKNDLIILNPDISNPKGKVLFSYINHVINLQDDTKEFDGHSNSWESREIAQTFKKLGYVVEAISWKNESFHPTKDYDIVFDIHANLQRLAPLLNKKTLRILHLTGSYGKYQNEAELKRIRALERRRNMLCSPKRLVSDIELADKSLKLADVCSLIGTQHTLNTYPKKHRDKITLVTVTASKLSYVKSLDEYLPKEKEFLWFFGSGAVHKGLDLVLEVFARNKNLILNIIGNIESEKDFLKIYKHELTELNNIRYHGYLDPKSKDFINIIKKSFCFIAPSCSESISTATATCLQLGLYPIISQDTGVKLPDNCGKYLYDCSIEEIEKNVYNIYQMNNEELKRQIEICQNFSLKEFSREKFSRDMTEFLNKAIPS